MASVRVMLSVLVLPAPMAPDWAAKPLGAALFDCTDQLAADGPVEDNCQGQVLKLPDVNCSENAPTAMSCAARPSVPGRRGQRQRHRKTAGVDRPTVERQGVGRGIIQVGSALSGRHGVVEGERVEVPLPLE